VKKYKVLITTSGIGSRLKELTKNTNKSLIKIGDKYAIEYIIDKYPKDVEFVITIGYLGDQVKEALEKTYPDRKLNFVWVDKYEGFGSSLGYSMLSAKGQLQCPFIFHCCDTIVTDEIPVPDKNWTAGCEVDDVIQYRTLNLQGNKVIKIDDKGTSNSRLVHIGLIGIFDYKSYWRNLEKLYKANPDFEPLNDTFTINEMLAEGIEFYLWPTTSWYDTGNPESLGQTKKILAR
jgi:NDP-sugar pyrophosphorylase family protein